MRSETDVHRGQCTPIGTAARCGIGQQGARSVGSLRAGSPPDRERPQHPSGCRARRGRGPRIDAGRPSRRGGGRCRPPRAVVAGKSRRSWPRIHCSSLIATGQVCPTWSTTSMASLGPAGRAVVVDRAGEPEGQSGRLWVKECLGRTAKLGKLGGRVLGVGDEWSREGDTGLDVSEPAERVVGPSLPGSPERFPVPETPT